MFVLFKQKTAYELRISAWRADVCSSALILRLYASACFFLLLIVRREPMDLIKAAVLCFLLQFIILAAMSGGMLRLEQAASMQGASTSILHAYQALLGSLGADQIGRASCRGRVCQYV